MHVLILSFRHVASSESSHLHTKGNHGWPNLDLTSNDLNWATVATTDAYSPCHTDTDGLATMVTLACGVKLWALASPAEIDEEDEAEMRADLEHRGLSEVEPQWVGDLDSVHGWGVVGGNVQDDKDPITFLGPVLGGKRRWKWEMFVIRPGMVL